MATDEIRLNKYLAEAGIASRREADRLIEEGKVTVNGKTALMGMKVTLRDTVMCDGRTVNYNGAKEHHVIAFYKPVGVVVTERDAHAEKKVMDLIDYPVRLTYAGRLDKDSEGLLILTNDGDLINAMMRGSNGHEKEYVVDTDRDLTEEDISLYSKGIYLKELGVKTGPCQIEKIGKCRYRIVLTQGLNRQIRRMFGHFDIKVLRLKRVRVMNIKLLDLKPGKYRVISGDELNKLYSMAGIK